MELEQYIIDFIVKTFNPTSIYIVGSSILNIDNFKDIDILCVYDTDDSKERIRLYSNKYKRGCEVFHATRSQVMSKAHRLCYAWSYLKAFRKCVYGEDFLAQFDSTDMLNNEEYKIELCRKIYQDFISAERSNSTFGLNFLFKPYRILVLYYAMINNSYTFTEEQIKILNEVHDSRTLSNELYNECKEFCYNQIVEICK